MGVSPVHLEMTSVGARARSQVTVTNDSSAPLPVEASLQRLTVDENGESKLAPGGGDEFVLFPPQALIPPGGTQVFRVQWVGEPMLDSSQSFLLSLSQIPVKAPKGQRGVQIAMSFGAIINVAPPQGLPELKLVGTGVATDKQGKRHPTITVENPTRIHALLPQSTIHLSGAGWSETLTPGALSQSIGIGLVQPGRRRKFILPVELPANVTNVEASLDFKPKRP
jgi:P pilus assembly chaperone PapD